MRFVAAALVGVLAFAMPAFAQDAPPPALISALTAGTRVRVKATELSVSGRGLVMKDESGMRRIGAVESTSVTELTLLDASGDRLRIPLVAITEVDVSAGKKRQFLGGLAIGAGIGLASGLLVPVDPTCDEHSQGFCSRGAAVGGLALGFGGMFGAIGAATKTDRWERRFTRAKHIAASLSRASSPARV